MTVGVGVTVVAGCVSGMVAVTCGSVGTASSVGGAAGSSVGSIGGGSVG